MEGIRVGGSAVTARKITAVCRRGPKRHLPARYDRIEAAVKPAGILEATNLATRADAVFPNPFSRSMLTPKSLSGTSSGLSGRVPNSVWRSPMSSFWRVDFPVRLVSQTELVIGGAQGFQYLRTDP